MYCDRPWIALILILLSAPALPADPQTTVRDLSLQTIDLMDRADIPALDKLLAPSFVLVRGAGQMSPRKEFLLEVQAAPPSANANDKPAAPIITWRREG